MKKLTFLPATLMLMLTMLLSSCEMEYNLHNAGLGFGMFIITAAIVAIIVLVIRAGRNNT